jgi:hypothetical protein
MSGKQRRRFTAEEIQELKSNKYTLSISETTITFTEAFYKEAVAMYQCGYFASSILSLKDYDTNILGRARVSNLAKKLKELSVAIEGTDSEKVYSGMQTITNERLKAENAVLRQELDFLKKVISVRTGKDLGK